MFGRKGRKGKGKAQAAAQATAQAKAFQVWYRDSIGRWVFASTHTNSTDAQAAVRAFTIAQAEIRPVF